MAHSLTKTNYRDTIERECITFFSQRILNSCSCLKWSTSEKQTSHASARASNPVLASSAGCDKQRFRCKLCTAKAPKARTLLCHTLFCTQASQTIGGGATTIVLQKAGSLDLNSKPYWQEIPIAILLYNKRWLITLRGGRLSNIPAFFESFSFVCQNLSWR